MPLLVLTAALILVAIRWLVADGRTMVRSAPGPILDAPDRVDAAAPVRSQSLEEAASPKGGRLPVTDERSASAEQAVEFELRHRQEGPAMIFRSWSDLRYQRSLGIHEVGLALFRKGRGVLHRGPQTEPDDELAGYWIDDQKRLVRVEIPEAGIRTGIKNVVF